MTTSTIRPQRRKLHFERFDDLLSDVHRAVSGPHVTLGDWSAAQILDHLTRTIDCSFDGFGFQAPLWMRWLLKPFRNGFLVKPMRSGYRLPKQAANLMPSDQVSVEEALARFECGTRRLQTENPTQLHPYLGRLTADEYRQLHLRHAELHLSFIVPAE